MAVPESALTQMSDNEIKFILRNIDTTGMSIEEMRTLATIVIQDLEASRQGFDFKPQRYKINKDNQTFIAPLGASHDELKGVVLHKQKVRAYWEQGNNVPLCSSLDCVTGADREGLIHSCKSCPHDAWGSASDDKEERRGKACKEMRRVYLVEKDGSLPILVTLSPTSIKPWDDFNSARATMGISDLSAETILRLVPGKSGAYTYSVIQPKNSGKIPPAEILRLHQMRQKFIDAWSKAEVTADDYVADDYDADTGTEGTPAGAAAAGDYEPY